MGIDERVWTRERARREGVSVARLTGGRELVRVVPGVYLEACWAGDHLSRCAAVTHAAPAGLISHRSGSLHRFVVDGLPVTGAVRAWCDAAATVGTCTGEPDLADLVATGDALLARRPDLRTDVGNVLTLRPACRGTVAVRTALPLLDGRSESAQESRLRLVLQLAGLAAPAVQHEVRTAHGRFVARVDLAYPSRRVAVEYDGDHHRRRDQWRHDLARRERLEAEGWRVVVVVAADLLGSPSVVVARVRSALAGMR